MKTSLLTFVLSIFVTFNLFSQTYESAPELKFKIIDDKPVVVILSTNGAGVLKGGDSLAIRIYDSDELIKVYGKNNSVNLGNTHVQILLPWKFIPNLRRGGVHYLRLNSQIYVYPNPERELQVEEARRVFNRENNIDIEKITKRYDNPSVVSYTFCKVVHTSNREVVDTQNLKGAASYIYENFVLKMVVMDMVERKSTLIVESVDEDFRMHNETTCQGKMDEGEKVYNVFITYNKDKRYIALKMGSSIFCDYMDDCE